MRRLTALTMLAVAAGCGGHGAGVSAPVALAPSTPQQVLIVSLDGFRWDYFNRPEARNLRRLAAIGVHATRMIPDFPSLTFPNHYSIATGLYPEHSGIVDNSMRDATLGAFRMSDTAAVRNAAWWGGEPIWVTAEKQGRHAGTFFWPGSEAAEEGVRPSHWLRFNDRFPNAQRVDSVLDWLSLPGGQAVSLAMLYYSDVDHAGHSFGPDSPQVDSAIARVDTMIGKLIDGIAARNLTQRVNLIVLADHGMTAISPSRAIYIDDYVPPSAIDIVDLGAIGLIAPHTGMLDSVYRKLNGANPHMHVYRKGELPARFHYDTNPRITPIVLVADLGWMMTTHAQASRLLVLKGEHGYDNQLPDMGALFVAEGPAFRRGITVPAFQNIHVYDLICHILGLHPAPNDGSADSTRAFLR
ncbi:MAG TPA: ectonucleotide pyrophosphatase/phosphodiesterase [Gemmatimonadales bacterium]